MVNRLEYRGFLIWRQGETKKVGRRIHADNPANAAIAWAELEDTEEYSMASGRPVKIMVADERNGGVERCFTVSCFTVTGEISPIYHVKEG